MLYPGTAHKVCEHQSVATGTLCSREHVYPSPGYAYSDEFGGATTSQCACDSERLLILECCCSSTTTSSATVLGILPGPRIRGLAYNRDCTPESQNCKAYFAPWPPPPALCPVHSTQVGLATLVCIYAPPTTRIAVLGLPVLIGSTPGYPVPGYCN